MQNMNQFQGGLPSMESQAAQMPQRQIPLTETSEIKCSNCGCISFVESIIPRGVSRLVSGKADDGIALVHAISCLKCGTPLEQTLPPELKSKIIS